MYILNRQVTVRGWLHSNLSDDESIVSYVGYWVQINMGPLMGVPNVTCQI